MGIAIVGAGYWGKNLIRTFNNIGELSVVYDLDESLLLKYKNDPAYAKVEFGVDYTGCLDRWDISGVVVATPPASHFEIAKRVLLAGKDVFIEKPMTLDTESSEELVNIAKDKGRVIMTGHIFLYSPEILKLKEIIHSPDFGDIRYAYTSRLNLGKVQSCGVVMDLAPHDVSILDFLFEDTCKKVKTTAASHVLEGVEDVAFIALQYKKGITAHLHLSWLDPLKVRNTVVVGTKQMVVCDSGTKKIDIYNMSVDVVEDLAKNANESYASHLLSYTYGDVVSPYIQNEEPMLKEAKSFIMHMKENSRPIACGEVGLSVVKTVSAMKRSLENDGQWEIV